VIEMNLEEGGDSGKGPSHKSDGTSLLLHLSTPLMFCIAT
jgi:hypothetical protein